MGSTFNEADHPRGADGRFVPKLSTIVWNVLLVVVIIYVVIHFRAGSRIGAESPTTTIAVATTVAAESVALGSTAATGLDRVQGVVVDRGQESGQFLVAVRVATGGPVTVGLSQTEWQQCTVGSEFDNALDPICISAK